MSKDQQSAVLKAAAQIEKKQWAAVRIEDANALEIMAKNGMKISEASPVLQKELDKMADKILNEYLEDASSDIKNIFKEYRK